MEEIPPPIAINWNRNYISRVFYFKCYFAHYLVVYLCEELIELSHRHEKFIEHALLSVS